MNWKKRLLTLTLTLGLLGTALAGCAQTAGDPSGSPSASGTPETSPSASTPVESAHPVRRWTAVPSSCASPPISPA